MLPVHSLLRRGITGSCCRSPRLCTTSRCAKEFGERRIRANAVSLGAIRTELGSGLSPDFEALLTDQTALGRAGEPEDVARVIAGLLGEDIGWVNAQSIEVAGGYMV